MMAFHVVHIAGQIDICEVGTSLLLINAKVEMFRGFMRVTVDKWGEIRQAETPVFMVDDSKNFSLVEYEQVNIGG